MTNSEDNIGRGLLFPLEPNEGAEETQEHMKEAILEQVFGFCGCGQTDRAIDTLYDYLCIVGKKYDGHYNPNKFDPISTNPGTVTLLHYVMYNAGMTEHGGSVPGWLTDDGWGLLTYILAYKLQHDENVSEAVIPEDLEFDCWEQELPYLPWGIHIDALPVLSDHQMQLLEAQFKKQGITTRLFDDFNNDKMNKV